LDEQPLSFSKGENLREDSKDRENMYEITFDIFDDFSELDYFF